MTINMASPATLRVSGTLVVSNPAQTPVVLIGQPRNIAKLTFEQVACKLQPKVSADMFKAAQESLTPSGPDSTPLYLNQASIAQLPSKCSRHNTPTQAHAVTKAIVKHTSGADESLVIVCEKRDVFASACAVARAFPLYSRKSGDSADGERAPKNERSISVEFLLVGEGETLSADEVTALEAAMEGVRLAARVVDTPCQEMNVCAFLAEIQRVGDVLGIKPCVIRGEELVRKGLGGIWSVGKAATSLPALAVLSHTPEGATETVAWVGKGIVYDTGGLSLKPRVSMLGMKRDCGGAAGILGAFSTAVKCGFKQNLHAVFCLAENAIGPLATRPDDVITMYSGKTVEVNNTDAEGRMVLADGVVYASKDLGAKTILDMATLTGTQGITTGKYHGAVLTNSSKWEDAALIAGKLSGDLVFPLPYTPELHFKEFSSAIADMKNSVADRSNAQSSCGGLFIQSHLGFDFEGDWIHIDMAAPAHCGERATGYGVALLSALFADYSKNPMINSLSPFSSTIPEEGDKKRIKTAI
ncbi:probable aminopeptidase NPEPL1 isoform X2 [Varroa jacobsoni]|uniref:Cytosol aminopeptidase domain-containing protein n=1 Tax=Varroa destructor TaxID=109461 RepID=A0A7M7JKN2_VARDE|nr:probable aminopeptidase NPEPL1 isoform X2 [Varroa destructor]XP_022688251.1 probable aminopeptidase NPEPL1 isoform X2 [Varroa jacobsoni]